MIVGDYMIRGPLGGMGWNKMQYLKGLAALGHEVYYFEDSDDYPSCYDPLRDVTDRNPSYGLEYARRLFDRIGFGQSWAYYDAHEVWEVKWQEEKSGDGDFYQGLIQFAVATLHWERNNAQGARVLFAEARSRMAAFLPEHMGLDVLEFLEMMEDYFEPLYQADEAGTDPPAPNVYRAPQIRLAGGPE